MEKTIQINLVHGEPIITENGRSRIFIKASVNALTEINEMIERHPEVEKAVADLPTMERLRHAAIYFANNN
jgi:hypothetical protein